MTRHRPIAFGLFLSLAFVSAPSLAESAPYAPIDCNKAPAAAEKTICGNYALGQDEARLATLYGLLTSLVAMGQRGDIMDAQQHWIASRNACGSDAQCLAKSYKVRIGDLSKQFDALAKRGPF